MGAKGGESSYNDRQDRPVLSPITITLVIVALLGYALRSGRAGGLILSRPYNNRYSDASGAREDHLG
jgi:hypothetical protein